MSGRNGRDWPGLPAAMMDAPQFVVSENGQFYLERELQRLAPDLDIRMCMDDV